MLPCHSCYIYGTRRSKEVGEFKVVIWREAEEGVGGQSQRRGQMFMVELTPQLFCQNYLHISASFCVKRVL